MPAAAPLAEGPTALRAEKGASVERGLEGEEVQDHPLRLEKGRYLDLRIHDRGDRVEVTLRDPKGLPVATGASRGQDDWKLLLWVTEIPGEYRVRVKPRDLGKPAGTYRIEIRDLRPATADDGPRVAAQELVRQGLQWTNEEEMVCRGLQALEQALGLWQQTGDAEGEADTLNRIGMTVRGQGRVREAVDWYEQTLTRAREAGYRQGEAIALNNLGFAYHQVLRDMDRALELYTRSLALWKEIGDENEEAFVLVNLGNLYVDGLRRFVEARSAFEQGVKLATQAGDFGLAANSWSGLGKVQYFEQDVDHAFQSFSRAFELSMAAGDIESAAKSASSLAVIYVSQGQLQKAIEFPLDILEEVEEPETRGYVLHALGGVYLSLGKKEEALGAYQRAYEIFRNLGPGFSGWATLSLTGLGWGYQLQGDLETALRTYQEAQSLDGDEPLVSQYLGMAYLALGQPERALKLFENALELAERQGDPAKAGETRLALGTAYRSLGQRDLAVEQLDLGIAVANRNKSRHLLSALLLKRAMVYRDTGRLPEALADIEEALGIVEITRQNVLGQDLRLSFFASRRAYQELEIDLLMRLERLHPGEGYQARALAASEKARARGLLDLLAEDKGSFAESLPPELKKEEDRLASDLSRIQGSLRAESSAAQPDWEKVKVLEEERTRLTERHQRLEWEIRKLYPKYARVLYPSLLDLPDIQAELDDQTALLEFALGQEGSYLFMVTRTGLETYPIPSDPILRERVLRLRDALERENRRKQHIYLEEARQLYQDLLAPAAPALAGRKKLLIVPDGALHLLPFEVLLTASGSGGFQDLPYLLRSYAIAYVPSASVLAELRSPRREPPSGSARLRFLAFADPDYDTAEGGEGARDPLRGVSEKAKRLNLPRLPASRAEVSEIAKLYPGSSKVYLEGEANEENVKGNELLARADRIHFATHGLPDESRPELSSLVLADEKSREGKEDGFLQAYEIFRLKLSADLVVLSACETALGKEVTGEGLVGLTRSFLYAGAHSLVVSLWSVSDGATPDLMVSFYQGLDQRNDKAEALQRAKLAMISQGRYAHPFYWAPFILIGDPKQEPPGM